MNYAVIHFVDSPRHVVRHNSQPIVPILRPCKYRIGIKTVVLINLTMDKYSHGRKEISARDSSQRICERGEVILAQDPVVIVNQLVEIVKKSRLGIGFDEASCILEV